jgi:hypothetical protein
MSEIFQHTEKIKRDVMGKISETSSALTDLRGEQETALKVMESVKVEAVKPIEPEVTLEDLNIMKRMIFEMKDFTTQTDNFVR